MKGTIHKHLECCVPVDQPVAGTGTGKNLGAGTCPTVAQVYGGVLHELHDVEPPICSFDLDVMVRNGGAPTLGAADSAKKISL